MVGVPGARSRAGRARLSRSADFDRVFRHGRSHAGRELVLYVFPRGESEEPRLGLSVSRKVGGAVQRNRVKRLLREAFVVEGERLPAGTDAVVVARREANALAEREGLAGIRRVLSQLVDRVAEPSPRGAGELGDRAAVPAPEPDRSAEPEPTGGRS
jgi:ribonuclease P protein component